MRLLRSLIALFTVAALTTLAVAEDAPTPREHCAAAEPAPLTMMQFERAEQVLDPSLDYRAIFCTSAGAIYVDLYEKLTPITVNNFVFLAQQGYYDNTTFHRVIPDFMAQGGDPTGTGRGGPGYQFQDEPIGYLTFSRPGLLAMANAGPGTNGSQIFITTAPTPHLNYKHTIFGDVLVGQENVAAIRERDPSTASEFGETLQTVMIITDSSAVDNSDVVELSPATQEQVAAAFEGFAEGLPPSLLLDGELGGYYSTDAVAQSAVAENLLPDFETFAEEFGHQYRYRIQIVNDDCDPSIFFSSLGYWVDVYTDSAAARAAAEDTFMLQWLDSYGYAPDESASAVYRAQAPTCAGEKGVHLLALNPHGRLLATLDVHVAVEVLRQAPPAALLQNLALQIEGAFASIYLPELR